MESFWKTNIKNIAPEAEDHEEFCPMKTFPFYMILSRKSSYWLKQNTHQRWLVEKQVIGLLWQLELEMLKTLE